MAKVKKIRQGQQTTPVVKQEEKKKVTSSSKLGTANAQRNAARPTNTQAANGIDAVTGAQAASTLAPQRYAQMLKEYLAQGGQVAQTTKAAPGQTALKAAAQAVKAQGVQQTAAQPSAREQLIQRYYDTEAQATQPTRDAIAKAGGWANLTAADVQNMTGKDVYTPADSEDENLGVMDYFWNSENQLATRDAYVNQRADLEMASQYGVFDQPEYLLGGYSQYATDEYLLQLSARMPLLKLYEQIRVLSEKQRELAANEERLLVGSTRNDEILGMAQSGLTGKEIAQEYPMDDETVQHAIEKLLNFDNAANGTNRNADYMNDMSDEERGNEMRRLAEQYKAYVYDDRKGDATEAYPYDFVQSLVNSELYGRVQMEQYIAPMLNDPDFVEKSQAMGGTASVVQAVMDVGYTPEGFLDSLQGEYQDEMRQQMAHNLLNPNTDGMIYWIVNGELNPTAPGMIPRLANYASSGYDLMTPTEVAVFNYYYNSGDKDTAFAYLDSMSDTLQRRARAVEQAEWEFMATDNPFSASLAWVASVGATAIDPLVTGVDMAKEFLTGEKSAVATPTNAFSTTTHSAQEQVLGEVDPLQLNIAGKTPLQHAYSMITSVADMEAAIGLSALTGVPALAFMGAESTASEWNEQLATDAPLWERGLKSALAGVATVASEKMPLDIIEGKTGLKGWQRFFGAGASEALEEGFEQETKNLTNWSIAKIKGEETPKEKTVELYRAMGIEHPELAAASEYANESISAMIGGFASGSLMAGTREAINASSEAAVGRQVNKSGGVENLVKIGAAMKEGSESQKIASTLQQVAEGKKVSARKVGQLYSALVKETTEKYRGEVQQIAQDAVEEQLTAAYESAGVKESKTNTATMLAKMIVEGDVKAVEAAVQQETTNKKAEALVKLVNGRGLTKAKAVAMDMDKQLKAGEDVSGKAVAKLMGMVEKYANKSTITFMERKMAKFDADAQIPIRIMNQFKAGEEGWTQDMEAERTQAAARHVSLLADIAATTKGKQEAIQPKGEKTVAAKDYNADAITTDTQERVEELTRRKNPKDKASKVVTYTDGGPEKTATFKAIAKDGSDISIVMDKDGEEVTVAVEDIKQVSAPVARVIAYAEGKPEITAVEMNEMIAATEETDGKVSASQVIAAYATAVEAGFAGAEQPTLQDVAKDIGAGTEAGKAIAGVLEMGYKAGSAESAAAETKRRSTTGTGSAQYVGVSYMGEVENERSLKDTGVRETTDALKKTLNPAQFASVQALEKISEVSGINIVLYRTNAQKGETLETPNGMFDPSTSTIYLDIDAGANEAGETMTESAILKTASHELTHYIEKHSAKGYAQLRDAMKEQIKAQGKDYYTLISEKLRSNSHLKTRAQAEAEVIADAAEMMLKDSNAMQMMAQRSPGLWNTVKNWLKDFVRRIKRAFSGITATSEEAQALMDKAEKYLGDLQDLWDNALVEAVGAKQGEGATVTKEEVPTVTQFSGRTNVEKKKDGLMAIHNLKVSDVMGSLELGGLPMPSIAIVKAEHGHDMYGEYSVIFGKETIDPEADKRNRVYGADAWTPVFPQVETEILDALYDSKYEIAQTAKQVDAEYEKRARQFFDNFATYDVTSEKLDDLVDKASRNPGILAAYLTEEGKQVEVLKKEVRADKGYNPDKAETYDTILDTIGLNDIITMKGHELLDNYGDKLAKAGIVPFTRLMHYWTENHDTRAGARMMTVIKEAIEYEGSGRSTKINTEAVNDYEATNEAMRDMVNMDDFKVWIRNVLQSGLGATGIYNGVDRYTRMGDRKSFKQTHMPLTAENVVKVMLKQNESEIPATDAKGLMAAASKRYSSVEEIRADAKRLGKISDEQYRAMIAEADNTLRDFLNSIEAWDYVQQEEVGDILVEAAKKNMSAAQIAKLFKNRGYGTISTQSAALAKLVLDKVQSIPSGYFEAKPARVVSFDEIRMVVAPDSMPAELETKLQEMGIPYTKYDGTTEDRLEKANDVQGVQFSIRKLSDGRTYVENDRVVITGNNPDVWRDQVMNYINNEIRKGQDVTFYGADGEPLTITEDTAGKARFRNVVTNADGTQRVMTDNEFKTKLRAETHIDELAQASRGNGRITQDTKNHPFAKDGFTYRTAYFKDASGYYRVTMSVGINGEIKTVYNVGKLKAASFPVDKVRGAQRPRGKQAAKNNISQDSDSVKQLSARRSAPSLRKTLQMMQPTEDMTAAEKELLGKYQGWLAEYEQKQQEIDEQTKIISQTEAKSAEQRAARNRMQVLKSQQRRVLEKIRKAESAEGFARMLNTGRQLARSLGGTDNLAEAQAQTETQLKAISEELDELRKQIGQVNDAEAQRTLEALFDTGKLNEAAKRLKDTFHSKMTLKELRNRIVVINTTMMSQQTTAGRDALRLVEDLTEDLTGTGLFDMNDRLGLLKERIGTITLTDKQKQELKRAGITQTEFRRVVNPVVRVAKSGGGDLMSYIEGDDYFGAGMGTGLKALFDGAEGEGDSILRLYEIIKDIREAEDPLANSDYAMAEDPMQAAMMDVMGIVTEATLLDAGTDTVSAMLKAVEKNVDKGSELETKVHDLQKKLETAKRNAPKAAKLSAVQSGLAWLGSYYEKIERARALAEAKESIEHTKRQLELENTFAMGAWYEAKENAEKRRKLMDSIRRQVKWMDTRIRKETDQKRVPENFKPVVEEMIRVLASANDTLQVFKEDEAGSILAVYQRLVNWDGKNLHQADAQLKEARMMDDMIVEDAEEQLEALKAKIFLYGGMSEIEDAKTRLKASIEVLEDINDLVTSVWHAITGIDNVFIAGQWKNIEEVGDELAKELNDKEDYKRKDNWLGKKKEQLDNKLVVGNMTPVYFFKQLGSNVLTRLNDSLLQAQNEYKFMQEDAIKKMAEIKQKRNYYAWKDTAPLTFTTAQGRRLKNGQHTLTLTVDQALSIWAIWQREQYSSPLLTSNHLEKGGMMLKGGEVTEDGYRKEGKLPHKITEVDVATIDNYLTEEMKAYATDLIKYMSTDLAAIGNETSMKLFGIRKFKEANYFPMKVERDQIEQSSDAGNREQKGNRAAGMSSAKRRVDQATKPLVIGGFTDTVAEHINDMLIYSTFAIPIESFNKVLNYAPMDDELRKKLEAGTLEEEDMDMASRMLIRGMIHQKYGSNMAQYLKKYLADVNGGPMQDFVEKNFFVKALSKFKKVSVMGRLSVVVQQYWALIRARYVMDNKYFMPGAGVGDKLKAADEWTQLRKYSGVARIKESGGFDMTGKGSAISEIVGSYSDQLNTVWDKAKAMVTIGVPKGMKMETAGKVWNDFLGWGAAKMDQLAWIRLWRAVKAETKDLYKDMDVKSDVFLKTAAKRFEEVVNLTQVYDSTLVRSQNMRSKSELMRMATSFMGEPTLTANMLIDALKTKSPKLIAKAACIYYANVIVTAAVKALVSAMGKRDDDDDKPWLEKYLKTLGGDLTGWSGELNPLGLFPGMSELMSLMDGYDAERSDLAAAADLVDKVQKLGEGYYDDKHWTYMLEDIATAVADVTGIPLKGLLSSGRTAVNYIRQVASGGDNRKTSGMVVAHELKANMTGGVLGGYVQNILPFMDTSYEKYYTDLYKAQLNGDTEKVAKLEEFLGIQGKSEQAIRTGVKKVIKAQYAAGALSGEDMQKLLVKLGYEDDLDDAYWTQQEWDYVNETGSDDGYKKCGDFLTAVETGKNLKAAINEYLNHGVDKGTLSNQITIAYRAQYVSLMKAGKKTQAANLQARILTAYEALGYDRQKKLKDIQKWLDE